MAFNEEARLSDHSTREDLSIFCGLTPPPVEEAAYEASLQRTIDATLQQTRSFRHDEAQVRTVLAVLQKGGLEAVDKIPRKISLLARMKGLLARSWQLRHEDPRMMVDLAVLAAQVSKRLDPRRYGAERVADFQAQAHAELGNACRVSTRLSEAAIHFSNARRFFENGTHDEILEIRLLDLEASLAADLRQFGRASDYLLKVLKYHSQVGDFHLTGRTLVKLGLYSSYAGDFDKGIDRLKKALTLIDAKRDPELACAAAHNLILSLVDSGRFPEAKKLRLVHARHLATPGGRVSEVKFRALEGRIDSGLGNHKRAEAIFREVAEDFATLGLLIPSGIASLNLAATFLAQGKAAEGKTVALEAAKTFLSLKIQREALEAVILLRNSFEMQTATIEKVEEVAHFLLRFQVDPAVRFEGRAWEGAE
jgi:tetratricopeptide (TPR) repeat protein